MIKTKTWVLILGGVLLLALLSCMILYTRPAPGTVANIFLDGTAVRSVDLSQVTEPFEFTLTAAGGEGFNVIRVEPGRIAVIDADCPDRVCVEAGWLSDSASPVVCLPHRLVIRIEKNAAANAAAEADPVPDTVSR